MTEPVFFQIPLSLLFLYFVLYAFLGWVVETCYCSILERRFVARGFLYGPICPIHGVGVLMMICWFAPLTGNPFLFYLVATVCMSAWEYLVGWFLEITTHIKYWDYSNHRFNLHGRICLRISLAWGALAYLVIFWLHPALSQVVESVSVSTRHVLAIVALILLTADTLATIHQLALVHRMMTKLSETADELRLQLALGKADLADYLDDARESLGDRLGDVRGILGDVRETINGKLDDAKEALTERLTTPSDTSKKLRLRYEELLDKIERATRHLRYTYRNMSSQQHSFSLSAVTEASRRYKAQRDAARTAKRDEKKRARKGKPT